ncbi:MAG: hypothetical protein AAGM67_10915 [Bacteroidota bacterium]
MRNYHQHGHWMAYGPSQYGDHLLFARLYENLDDEIDELAEKIVGVFGVSSFTASSLVTKMHTFVLRWDKVGCPFKGSLMAEKALQKCLQETYDKVKENGDMSLGLDDYIMSLASAHETALYLLQLRLKDQIQGDGEPSLTWSFKASGISKAEK